MASLSEAEKEKLFPLGITNSVATELHEFVQTCLGRSVLEVDGYQGLKDVALCFACYESSATGMPVTLDDVESCSIEVYQGELNRLWGIE